MRIDRLEADVERRLLITYRADPDVVAPLLPAPLRPKLAASSAVVGLCFVRLGHVRPAGWPHAVGLRSESGAHRVAVEWDTEDGTAEGVFILRRDTSSVSNLVAGGRLYPGVHHRASFRVTETAQSFQLGFTTADHSTRVDVCATVSSRLGGELFADAEDASGFFQAGCLGLSPGRDGTLDAVELHTDHWAVEPVEVNTASSSLFDDPARFPPGSIKLDSGLVMRGVPVTWVRAGAGPAPTPHRQAAPSAG